MRGSPSVRGDGTGPLQNNGGRTDADPHEVLDQHRASAGRRSKCH